ncbi:MAG: hypothetical protein AABW50_03230 [Nanoarchaeota archaeon]
MDLYAFILQNREILKVFYALFIILVCFLIVLKSHRIFKLSSYEGIRYFRNAFLFYGLAFFSRYLLSFLIYENVAFFLFEFFIVMAGFVLLYSLIWKKFEYSYSSLVNVKILVLYLFALVISVGDLLINNFYLMFLSQVIVFMSASIISYNNYLVHGKNKKFPRFYVAAMVLSLIVWILNALAVVVFAFDQAIIVNLYILNMLFFLLFLYGIIKASRG